MLICAENRLPVFFRRIVIVREYISKKRIIAEKAVDLIGDTASLVFESVWRQELAVLFLEVPERLYIILDLLPLCFGEWRLCIVFILSSQ